METKQKFGQEPAFPANGTTGISKRTYIAVMAMQGILSGDMVFLRSDRKGDSAYPITVGHEFNVQKLAKNAFEIADAMLAEENREEK